MSEGCCKPGDEGGGRDGRYLRVLWAVLVLNAAMFVVEIVAGLMAGSASLQADALDFFADTANYGISLFVVGRGIRLRAGAALAKGATMAAFGVWVLLAASLHLLRGTLPVAATMGAVGFAAMIANAVCFALLWAHRTGDSNRRSVWLCSRNDVLGNLAVLLAALGVFRVGAGWPDVIVAVVMGGLALQGSAAVIRQAVGELSEARA